MIGTHYNHPPNADNVQTLVDLLGKPRYRNSLREIVPFEATVIRQVKACGSSGWSWIEEDYAEVVIIFDRAGWDKDIKIYQRGQPCDLAGYFSQQYLRRTFLPTMDSLFAATGIPAPIWPDQPYGRWEDDSVAIPELSLKFNVGVSCAAVSYRPPYLMETNIKIEQFQEEPGIHRYSKEDLTEALAQHFQSAIALPPL